MQTTFLRVFLLKINVLRDLGDRMAFLFYEKSD